MIYGDRVRQAREIRGMTQRQLADDVGKNKSLIAQVEVGMKAVSEELLGLIAMATRFPLSFFSEPPLVEFPIQEILFRARSNVSRKAMVEAVRTAESAFNIGVRMARQCRNLPVLIPVSQQPPPLCARATRTAMGIETREPMPHLIRSLEKIGVWVLALPQLEGRDAFCVWARADDREFPVIAYSTGVPGDRLRLSIAHEVGHLVMHKRLLKTPVEMESEAYEFGAELLMPEAAMRKELVAPLTLTSVARLKPRWGVSIQALIRRAYELQMMTERQYRYLFYQLSTNGWRTEEPENLNVKVEKPRLLRKMAETLYGVPIHYERLAKDSHIAIGELKAIVEMYADKAEVTPKTESQLSSKVISFSRAGRQ